MASPNDITFVPDIDLIAAKAVEIAKATKFFNLGWDDFDADEQVSLLNHCVLVVRTANRGMVINVPS